MNDKKLIESIQDIAKKTKTDAYLVGGIVRDKLLGIKTKDIDIVVIGSPKAFVKEIKERFDSKCLCYKKFGTYVFDLKNNFRIDVATSRSETYRSPAVLPVVKLGVSLKEDLSRRDFTINAMAIKLVDGCLRRVDKESLIDPFNGYSDIKKKLIRVLHKKSFIDDPTRIIRAVRFACRFDFKLEKNTKKYIKDALDSGCIEKLSPARRTKELMLVLNERKTYEILQLLGRLKVLRMFFPEVNFKKIKRPLKSQSFYSKLKTLLRAVDKPDEFLLKYQFPRKIKSEVLIKT